MTTIDQDGYLTEYGMEFARPGDRPDFGRVRSPKAARTQTLRAKRPSAPQGLRQRRNRRWSW